MKKKLLFMVINMNVGGTEKALINLISEIPKADYEITILMLEKYGGFLESIPESVNIRYLFKYEYLKDLINTPPKQLIMAAFKQKKLVKAMEITFLELITKLQGDKTLYYRYLLRKTPVIEEDFYLAVAYAGPMEFISYFVMKKIKAKKKMQWIHFDVTKIGFNPKFASKVYRKFNKVIIVSDEGKKKLLELVPTIKEKARVSKNIISVQNVVKQSYLGQGFKDEFDGIRILTVGRLSKEKGQDLAIRVLAKLLSEGHNVKWYCIGEGNSRSEYEAMINKYCVKDHFILLGTDPNPYTYFSQCDIYVQPSRYEGYCITLMEAKCFNKPIVATNVNGVNEQIKNGKTGLIVDINEKKLYESIKKLIEDSKLRSKFANNLNLEGRTPNNVESEVNKILDDIV